MSFLKIVWPYLKCRRNLFITLAALLLMVGHITVVMMFVDGWVFKVFISFFSLIITILLLMGATFDVVTDHSNITNAEMLVLFSYYGIPFDRHIRWSEMQNWMDENHISVVRSVRIYNTRYYLFKRSSDVLAFKLCFYE